jgi:hypothetical protein
VQAAHAAITFCSGHPIPPDCTVVLLVVPDEEHLSHLLFLAGYASADTAEFREPDLGNQLTAIALAGEGAERLCRKYPLAFSQREEVR